MECIIVEDNEIDVLLLRKCIQREGGLELKGVFNSGVAALNYLNENSCDLLLLDVEIEGMNGIELIKQLINCPQIIIISFKTDYAVEAFNFDVVDYIVKPINFERFHKAITKAKTVADTFQKSSADFFYLKSKNKMVQVYFNDIVYVEALADYVNIHTTNKKHTILSTMKAIENQFPKKDFLRIHRSFIVRLDRIAEIEENSVRVGEKLIPVSKINIEEFQKRIKYL
jgi:DNA-binding LytR/AlgR family response regulator